MKKSQFNTFSHLVVGHNCKPKIKNNKSSLKNSAKRLSDKFIFRMIITFYLCKTRSKKKKTIIADEQTTGNNCPEKVEIILIES